MRGPITLSEHQTLDTDKRWELVGSTKHRSVRVPATLKRCLPNNIGLIWCSVPFPHYPQPIQGTSIVLDDDNIYNGHLEDDHPLTMRWEGYITQVYDGDFRMRPVNLETSTISGVCNGIAFHFTGVTLDYGCWPCFIEMYVD